MVLFKVLYKVVETFEFVEEILKCDHAKNVFEQYFPVVLFVMLYKVLWIKSCSVAIEMKATEHYFPVVLFVVLYKVMWMKSKV